MDVTIKGKYLGSVSYIEETKVVIVKSIDSTLIVLTSDIVATVSKRLEVSYPPKIEKSESGDYEVSIVDKGFWAVLSLEIEEMIEKLEARPEGKNLYLLAK